VEYTVVTGFYKWRIVDKGLEFGKYGNTLSLLATLQVSGRHLPEF